MKRTNLVKFLLPFTAILLLFSVACDYAASTAPEAPTVANVVSADEINWVSWKPEIVEKINLQNQSLFKKGDKDDEFGSDSKWIEVDEGGTVGNKKLTLGNKVKISKDALRANFHDNDEALVSVELIIENGDDYYGEVEFRVDGGHYQFEKDVTITLSYKYLDIDDDFDTDGLSIWWYDDDEEGWVPLDGLKFNTDKQIVTFKIDHFTRYGWAF